jgi:hypothetical protein
MSKIGICGLDCSACYRYQASRSGKLEDLELVKQFYVRIGLLQPSFPARDLACAGCGPGNRCAYPEVRACALARGAENCGRCESYPCEKIALAFEQKSTWIDDIASKCTAEEHATLKAVFCSRKINLDRICAERQRTA